MVGLTLTCASERFRFGSRTHGVPSRFLQEIPSHLLEIEESPELGRRGASADNVYAFFGRQSPPRFRGGAERRRAARPDAEEHQVELAVRRGSRVRHAVLGAGQVLQIEGSGEEARLIVYFENVGRRKLLVKYAQLEVV